MLPTIVLAEIEALLAQVRAGDAQALDTLIAKSLPYMKKYLAPAASSKNAEGIATNTDVVMDAAARAVRKFSSFNGTTAPSFLSWLKRIVVRGKIDAERWANRQKRKAVLAALPVELPGGLEPNSRSDRPSERLDAIETWLSILSALLALPKKQREPFWLCCICERSQDEVAVRLGRSRGTIAGDINRAREALQDVLRSAEQTENEVAGPAAAQRRTSTMPIETMLLAGCFEMGLLVATGTVCRVFHGADRRTGTEVAISVLNYEHCSSPETVARFVNESFWLRSVSSPYVATVLSGGMLPGGQPFLVQEWLPLSLADVVKQGVMASPVAQAVIQQVVQGVTALHASSLIHRDISPSGFRMSRFDTDAILSDVPSIKLTSLRLAKSMIRTKSEAPLPISTVGGVLPGAIEYRAPELWLDSKQASERADVYSIAALWYALLTGCPPFVQAFGESVHSLMQRCLHSEPPLERLPEPNRLLRQMLSKIPSERPSLSEVSDLLRCK